MNKKLIIIRHGKSSWNNVNIPDKERSLKKKGVEDAGLMGKILSEKGILPDMIISSPAVRAVSTAEIISRQLGKNSADIIINKNIYTSSLESLLEIISGTDDKTGSLMIFGHNPVFTDLVNYFSSDNIFNLPTCGTAIFRFQSDSWRNISKSSVTGRDIEYPKKYR